MIRVENLSFSYDDATGSRGGRKTRAKARGRGRDRGDALGRRDAGAAGAGAGAKGANAGRDRSDAPGRRDAGAAGAGAGAKGANAGPDRGDARILKDVSFQADQGQLVALIGPNGAGKSTLFKCILKFLKGYEGRVLLDGRDMKEMTRAEIARKIAYIPQTTIPVFNYPVLDIVLMGQTSSLKLLETPNREHVEKAERVLAELGILHLRDRGFGRISGGERQLVLLARALVQDAKILVMDEPTANLDYGNQLRVMERIRSLANLGYTVILSTHNPEHALLFADTSIVLQAGIVRAAGPSKEVLTEELMQELYGVEVRLFDTEFDGEYARVCVPVKSVR